MEVEKGKVALVFTPGSMKDFFFAVHHGD